MAALLTLVLAIVASSVFFFILGRKSSDRRRTLNHHYMMMLLMDLRTKDDVMPTLSEQMRIRVDSLLSDYERLDFDDDRGSATLGMAAAIVAVVAAAGFVLFTIFSLVPG